MRRQLAALLFAAALLTPAACGTTNQPSAPPPAGQPDKVNVGVIAILDVAPIYLGKQKGFFASRNIDLTLTTAQGGAVIVPGVQGGQFQFGFSNVISLLLAQSQNLPLKIVCNGNNSTGVDGQDFGSLMVKGDSPITSAKELEGKKVAINTLRNIAETVVRASVKKAGGDASKVQFVEMPFPNMAAALQSGQVDAAFPVEPFQTAIRDAGGKSIASSWVDAAPNLTVAAYFTSTQTMETRKDLVDRFTAAMKESLAYADSHPDEARQIITTYTQITAAQVAKLTLPKWPAEINRDSLQKLAELAMADGLLKAQPDLNALLPSA
ncbi:MAG TPA: ABC transporter substrate-binding protein [Micromonosporaceae bacterium]|nr:ABC transporter substrate-binding protein [Micromonosporaceae bacterium]